MNNDHIRDLFNRVTQEYSDYAKALVGGWATSPNQLNESRAGIDRQVDAWKAELEKLLEEHPTLV